MALGSVSARGDSSGASRATSAFVRCAGSRMQLHSRIYMHSTKILIAVLLGTWALPTTAGEFSGTQALEFTRAAVAFGPRPSGSPAIAKLQAYILSQLKL